MKTINIENWERRDHYEFFRKLDVPQYSMTANVDVTDFYKWRKDMNLSFSIMTMFCVLKAVNSVTEFKYRINNQDVVLHDIINGSFTAQTKGELFSICYTDYTEDPIKFHQKAMEAVERKKGMVDLTFDESRNDVVYISNTPWTSFTSLTHPFNMNINDCVPNITWGKFFANEGKLLMPVATQVHHSFVDGIHLGKFYNNLQNAIYTLGR